MVIIGTNKLLYYKLFSIAFKDFVLRWYMNLPHLPIANYKDQVKKLSNQFYASKHRKISSTDLFNIHQTSSKSLRESLVHFSKVTIKFIHQKQELFVGAFQMV